MIYILIYIIIPVVKYFEYHAWLAVFLIHEDCSKKLTISDRLPLSSDCPDRYHKQIVYSQAGETLLEYSMTLLKWVQSEV